MSYTFPDIFPWGIFPLTASKNEVWKRSLVSILLYCSSLFSITLPAPEGPITAVIRPALMVPLIASNILMLLIEYPKSIHITEMSRRLTPSLQRRWHEPSTLMSTLNSIGVMLLLWTISTISSYWKINNRFHGSNDRPTSWALSTSD